jgi:hypothetical protein
MQRRKRTKYHIVLYFCPFAPDLSILYLLNENMFGLEFLYVFLSISSTRMEGFKNLTTHKYIF